MACTAHVQNLVIYIGSIIIYYRNLHVNLKSWANFYICLAKLHSHGAKINFHIMEVNSVSFAQTPVLVLQFAGWLEECKLSVIWAK